MDNLQPSEDHTARYGWIAPTGDYFPCIYAGHSMAAVRIVAAGYALSGHYGAEDALEKAGWIHLSDGAYFYGREATRRQMDTLFDICHHNGEMGLYESMVRRMDRGGS